MKIEMFNVGWISSSAAVWREGEDPEHADPLPRARISGGDRQRAHPHRHGPQPGRRGGPRGLLRATRSGALRAASSTRTSPPQVDVGTLTRVVLTHLHFDHAGALALLPNTVPVVLQRSEWEGAHDAATVRRNFFYPRDYEALEDRDVVLVDGDHDLLGDGSVRLLLTPGHTPGHQSVMVGERLVLGGDVAHFSATLDDKRFPAFADDYSAQSRSADRLRQLRDSGMTVLPGHDPDVLRPGPLTA